MSAQPHHSPPDSLDRYALARPIFLAAIQLEPAQRAAFLIQACGTDAALHKELESLLSFDASAHTLSPVIERFIESESASSTPPPAANPTTFPPSHDSTQAAIQPRSDSRDHLPHTLGHFKLLEVLGTGSFGTVYRAQQHFPKRTVALKLLHPHIISPSTLRQFRHEALALARLRHPGIAQIHEAGTIDGRPFIAMEYVQGQSLAHLAAAAHAASAPTQSPPARWLSLIASIADALAYAHRQGVIHLDLKPGNIMIDESGQPRIVDFGIARLMSDEATLTSGHAATLTGTHADPAGTIGYMSPEQAEGTRGDTRSDLYAIGLILYELLSSTRAFITSGLSLPAALALVRTQHPRPLHQLAPHCSADTCAIVAKAIDKNPDQRYASMAQFAADVRHLLSDEPISIRPPTLWSLTRRALARHRVAVTAVAALLIALSASIGLRLRSQAELASAANINRRTVGVLLSSIIEPNSPLIGTNEARTRVLEELAPTLSEFAAPHTNDAAVQSQYARYLELLADAQLERGLIDAAFPARQQVLDIRTRLAESAPTDLAAQANLATALIKWGDIIGAKGNRTQAIDIYERALAVQEPILEHRPSDLHALSDVAWSCQRLSEWHRRLDNPQRAHTLELRHEALARTMLSLAPDNADALSLLSAALIARNGEAFVNRDYKTSIALLTEARTTVAKLREIAPDHRIHELRWLSVLQALAAAERHGISDAAGLQRLNEAITHARTLIQPTDADSQHQLASLLLAQATALLSIQQPEAAKAPLTEAVAIARSLAAASPAPTSHTQLLASALAQQGHFTGTAPVDESIALFEQLLAASPEDPAIKGELANALAIAASQPQRGNTNCYELACRACMLDHWSHCHILNTLADAARRANQQADAAQRLTSNSPADTSTIPRREAAGCIAQALAALGGAQR